MNEFEKNGFATFIDNGDGWERIPNAKFMMRDEDGTEIEMTSNEVIKQLMKDNKSLEHHINNLQSKIDKANELIKRKLSTETYQHLKKLYDDIDSTEEIWEDYEFEDLRDILKEDK